MPPPAVAVHRSRALARPPRLRDRLAAWPSGGGVAERRRFGTAGAGTGSRSDLPSAAADAGRGGRCAAGRGAKGRHPSAGRPLARSDPAPWPRDQFGALGRRTAAGGAGRGKADFSVTGVSHRQPCRRARPGSVALGRNGAAQSWRSHRGAGRRRWRICETAPGRDLRGCRRDRGITVRHPEPRRARVMTGGGDASIFNQGGGCRRPVSTYSRRRRSRLSISVMARRQSGPSAAARSRRVPVTSLR
jgi:hypothetical protein